MPDLSGTIVLKSMSEEYEDCKAACSNTEPGTIFNFVHHELPVEAATFPIADRIAYILRNKRVFETEEMVALRLRLLRPALIPEELLPLAQALKVLAAKLHAARQDWIRTRNEMVAPDLTPELLAEKTAAHGKANEDYDRIDDEYQPISAQFRQEYSNHFKQLFGKDWDGSIFTTFQRTTEEPIGAGNPCQG